MHHDEIMKKFHSKRQRALAMGGEKKLAAHKAASKLNARERIDYLLDDGTWQEIGLFARPGDFAWRGSEGSVAARAGDAGGLELALWCDLRIAEADAVLGVFCRRWGVPLIDGGYVTLALT